MPILEFQDLKVLDPFGYGLRCHSEIHGKDKTNLPSHQHLKEEHIQDVCTHLGQPTYIYNWGDWRDFIEVGGERKNYKVCQERGT
jgi:hypothetical protein